MKTQNQPNSYSCSIGLPGAKPIKSCLVIALLVLCGVGAVEAANVTLKANDAAGSTSFTGAGNWNNSAAPSAGNDYYTTNFTLRTPNPTTTGNTYTFGGDLLSIDTGGRFLGKIGNNVGGNTTVGTITVNNLILNGGMFDQAGANSDTAKLVVAGNVTVNASSIIGALGGTGNGSASFETVEFTAPISGSGALLVSGAGINAGGDTGLIKLSAANPYAGTITVSNGTGNIIASAVNRILQLNDLNALSNATLNLQSGQASPVSFASGVNTGEFEVGSLAGVSPQTLMDTAGSPVTLGVGGNNSSSLYAGALTDGGNLDKIGTGTLTLTGTNTYYGTTTVDDGSLQLGNGGAGGALSTSSGLTVNGNLTINRNNTVAQGVDFTGNPITGSGSFTQAGAGTTILNAANNYSGTTTISAGKLVISSAQAGTGAITVADGATLDVAVSGGSQLSPSTLILGTSATTALDFDSLSSTTVSPINAGTFSAGGTVTINISSGTFAAGNNYPLIHWSSGLADASAFALGLSPGLTATLSVSGSTLYLNVTAVSDVWTGATDGNWDTTTANWAGHASIFSDGDAVLFDSTANNDSVTVNAPVQPASVIFNNSSAYPYTVASSGANNIGGNGGLSVLSTGSVTLSGGANTYTGVTTVNAGILSVGALANGGSPSDIGAAVSDPANLVLNGGTLQYTGGTGGTDRGATLGANGATLEVTSPGIVLTDGGTVIGAGPLVKTGNGALVLTGANTFAGGVQLSVGEVDIDNGGSSSANSAIGTGTLTIGSGTVIDNTSANPVTLLPNNAQVWNGNFTFGGFGNNLNMGTGPVSLPATCTVTVFGNTLTVGGTISGAGGLTKAGAGTLVLSSASTYTGTTELEVGTLAVGNDSALGTGLLDLNGGIGGATIQSADGSAHTITNSVNFDGSAGANTIFGGTGNLRFTAASIANGTAKTLTVNNPQTEFTGVFSGVSAKTVAGTGTLILSGANTYSSGTIINSGATLQLGNGSTNGSLSTSGAIDDEGTLKFDRSDSISQGIQFANTPIVGAGSVVQAGTGIVTLNAANTYSGQTIVNSGELIITPAYQGGGDVIVADNASFGVTASSVTNSAVVGNLTLGSSGSTTLDFSYGLVTNPTNAVLTANTVTINGTSAIRIGGSFALGTFPLLKYGTLSGTFNSTVAGPRGVTATLFNDTANHVIDVTVTAVGGGIVWTGTNDVSPNLWDLNTTYNWLSGGLPTDYIENVPPGDAVTFNDTGSGTVLLSNTVSPASVTISNNLVAYTFQGSGQINALGALTKIGGAAVTMNVPATFSSGAVISNGTYNVGANQTFGNLSGDSAINASAGAPSITVNSSQNTTYAGNISGIGTFTKNGTAQFTTTASNSVTGNVFVSGGILALNSGVLNAGNYCSIGYHNTDNGILTLEGTAGFTTTSDFNAGDTGSAVGTLNIQDTANLTANSIYIGSANATGSTASGTVNQTGGTVTEQNTTAGTFCIGGRTSGTSMAAVGTYNLSSGSLNAASIIRVGAVGQGTFNQTGGTVTANAGVDIATATGAIGTYELDGGVLKTLSVGSSSHANSTFNLNGGILTAIGYNASFLTNVAQVNIRNGGMIVDTTNFIVTIGSALQHSSIGGDNAVDGGLTKLGSGTLILGGAAASYTGPTMVEGGTLSLLPNSINNLNGLTLNNGALSLNLNLGSGSFSATSLTVTGNSALDISYDLLLGAPSVPFNISGNLNVSGTLAVNVNGYGFTVGQYPLLTYTGTPPADLSHFSVGALPVGVDAYLSNNIANASIDLVVTSVQLASWIPLTATDPAGTSGFNAAGTWLNFSAPTPDNGYFTRTFALRSPADANAYTFAGAALSVDPGGRFIMKGANGQVITVPNLIMNGGLVDYANGGDNNIETLGGGITLQNDLTSYLGALGSTGLSETLYVTSTIGGSGDLQIGGANENSGTDVGVVVLSGANTYTGTTTVATGTLLVNGNNGNSPVTVIANGTLGGTGDIGGTVNVQAGGKLAPGVSARGALTNSVGTLTANSAVSVSGAVVMKINPGASPASDELVAPSVTLNAGATLAVNNIGSTNLVAGETFVLFSTPVSGAFGTIVLPTLPNDSVMWTNQLAINGTIAVIPATGVNTNGPTLINSIAGGVLTLSWPADHTGWTLQMQTNSLATGLSTNWVDVAGSTTTNAVAIPITTTNGAVFYRLKQ